MTQYLWQYKDGSVGNSSDDPAGGNPTYLGRADGSNTPAAGLWGNTTNSGSAPTAQSPQTPNATPP